MDGTKKIVIIVISVLILLALTIGLLFGKNKPMGHKNTFSYSNPLLSKDGSLLACFKYSISVNNDSLSAISAQLNIIDFKYKTKKQYFTIDLSQKSDIKLISVSNSIVLYEITDYAKNLSEKYSFSIPNGISTLVEKTEYIEKLENPENNDLTAVIEQSDQVCFVKILANESTKSIMETTGENDYFYRLAWAGNNLIFMAHIQKGQTAEDELWLYNPEAGLKKLESNCSNFILSCNKNYVTSLIPAIAKNKKVWQMSCKKIESEGSVSLISDDFFNEEVFLYEWSPSEQGFIIQKGNTLCFYDITNQKTKLIQNADKEGWWGYPESPYYIAFNPDGTKLAILSYRKTQDEKYMEFVNIFDLKSDSKNTIYQRVIQSFGKKLPFKTDFYKHIFWDGTKNIIFLESKNPDSPSLKRIISISPDGSSKKLLMGGFLEL